MLNGNSSSPVPVSGLPLRPLTNRGSQAAINPAAVLVPGDVPSLLKDTGWAHQQHRTSKPPLPVGTGCPSPEAATTASLAPLEVCFLQRDVLSFSSASRTLPPASSPTCFPLLAPFLSSQYKLQSHTEFILMRHYCLSFWISRRRQSNAKDTLITKGVSRMLYKNTQNIIKTNCYRCQRKLPASWTCKAGFGFTRI